MYAPVLARFTALDPLPPDGEAVLLGASRYAYVRNNPANLVDPSGEAPSAVVCSLARKKCYLNCFDDSKCQSKCDAAYAACMTPPPPPPIVRPPLPTPGTLTPRPDDPELGCPPPRGNYCGQLVITCASGRVISWPVYGNSTAAGLILRGSGCVTLGPPVASQQHIICTGSCKEIKTQRSGDNPAASILSHEACHACASEDGGYVGTIRPAPDPCVNNERPATPRW